jgi:predicted RNA-binding protein YlxR (DUF448 family)
MKEKLRMCIVCKARKDKSKLFRISEFDGNVFLDLTSKAEGRGAYVCSQKCFLKAKKSGAFKRALKCEVPEETMLALENALINAATQKENGEEIDRKI